jgi:hypothetical protein
LAGLAVIIKNTLTQNTCFVSSTCYYVVKSLSASSVKKYPVRKTPAAEYSFIISKFIFSERIIITRKRDEPF